MYEENYENYEENYNTYEEKNGITYDEGWQNASYSEYFSPNEIKNDDEIENQNQEKNNKKVKKSDNSKQILITVQLVLCIIIVICAYTLKFFGGDFYRNLSNWYHTELNKSIIASSNGDNFNLSDFFNSSTNDEI